MLRLTSTSSPASNSHRLRRARLDENLNTQLAVDAPRSRRLRLPSRTTPIRASIAAGLTQSGNHMDQCSRRVLWSAGSLPCCARAALAYTRMLSKPSRAPRRRNFEWRVFTPPKKIRLSSDCSGRRRKLGLDRDRARPEASPGSPKADVEPALAAGSLIAARAAPTIHKTHRVA